MGQYYPKSLVKIRGEFKNPDTGAYVNPDVVRITVQREGSTSSPSVYEYDSADVPSATLTKTSDGIYDKDFDTTGLTPGDYNYEVWGSGTWQTVNQGTFTLLQSKIA